MTTPNPKVSVIMPVYNVERYVAEAVQSVLAQTYGDFELLIVDDGGQDRSIQICEGFDDPRIRILNQANRGLAGARNTGILTARGQYVAFLDSDDRWLPEKLALHVIHLDANPQVGVSYAPSRLIDEQGAVMRLSQSPKLTDVSAADIFCRNPVGNGSAPVIRREALAAIAFSHPTDPARLCHFDETLRQSEDIECWLRLALVGKVRFEGIATPLTDYRIASGGLSAQILRQYATWEGVVERTARHSPDFIAQHLPRARAYQLRYLARRALQLGDPGMANTLLREAFRSSRKPLTEEPVKSLMTLAAAYASQVLSAERYARLMGALAGGRLVA